MGFFKNIGKALGLDDGGAGKTLGQATDQFKDLNAPSAEDLTYRLQNLVQQGVMTPEQAMAFTTGPSAMEDITVDPRLRDAQMGALSSLQDIGNEGGLTTMDKAKVGQLLSAEGQQERGSREAIMQHEQEMGRGGSGLELAAELENQQGAATRASQAGTDIAAQAEQRALDAIRESGQLGGQMEGQQFGEAAQKASAADTLAQFNATHLQQTNAANTAANNAAQAQNLGEKQRVSDTNAGNAGQNAAIAANAKQTVYSDELNKRKAIADTLAAQAKAQQDKAATKSSFFGNLIGAGGQIGAAALLSDEKEKDVEPGKPDLEAFMAELRPLAFKYKHPGAPGASPGENVGVTAQDVEKSSVGKTMVEDTPGGKVLNTKKGFGTILAALAELHDEIEELKTGKGE